MALSAAPSLALTLAAPAGAAAPASASSTPSSRLALALPGRGLPACKATAAPRASFGRHSVVAASAAGSGPRHLAADVAAGVSAREISFQFEETTFSVHFTPELAQQLKASIDALLQTFREKEKATRPQRWQSLEFRHRGEDGLTMEVFCNPNAHSNAFQAKALVSVKSDKVRITSEGPLSAVKSSVEEYLGSA